MSGLFEYVYKTWDKFEQLGKPMSNKPKRISFLEYRYCWTDYREKPKSKQKMEAKLKTAWMQNRNFVPL